MLTRSTSVAFLSGALLISSSAIAQETNPGLNSNIDEITVSARKRDESLQEVPISIVTLNAEQLRNRNIDNAYDISQFTPNFSMARNLGRRLDRPIIRGQFQPGRGDPNASFFVDGVFVSGSIAQSSLDNLERVEVLRGPQAALFGRATFAGAVNYITKALSDSWVGEINSRAGSDSDYKLSAWTSGPLIEDKLKVYVGAGYQSFDGEWRNGLKQGQVNASNDPATSLDYFNGPFVWVTNVPDIASGELPCPAGYRKFSLGGGQTAADAGCPSQRGDNSEIGGEESRSTTLKIGFTPTDNFELNFKSEYADTDDGHYVSPYWDHVFAPVDGIQLAPGLNCNPPVYDPSLSQTLPDGTVLDGTYIPSPGWYCGELDIDGLVSQFNIPHLSGVATCPPGTACVQRDGGIPILDENGNVIPIIQSAPAPFIGAQTNTQRYLVEGIYNFADWRFVARGTTASFHEEFARDLDRTYALGPVTTGLFEGYTSSKADDKSVELRVSSPLDSWVSGLLGFYYYEFDESTIERRFNSFSDSYLWGFSAGRAIENSAIFGSLEFNLSDTWNIALDARYAEDTITRFWNPEATASCEETAPPGTKCRAEATFDSFTPRVTVRYQPNDDLNFYILAAKGNKPGGFNFQWFDDGVALETIRAALGEDCSDPELAQFCDLAIVKEEKTWTYELGAKTTLFDERVVANGALFYIDWTNQAINRSFCAPREDASDCETFLGNANAGKSNVYGVELELTWFATDYLNLGLNYGLAATELKEFYDDQLASFSCNWWAWSQTSAVEDIPDCDAQGAGNAAGKEGVLVPKHNLNLSADYQRPLKSDVDWFVRSYLNYQSKQYTSVSNDVWIGDSYIWNASLGLRSDHWLLSAYLNNILDDDTPTVAFDFPLFDGSKTPNLAGYGPVSDTGGLLPSNAFLLTPRRGTNYGLTLQYRFGG